MNLDSLRPSITSLPIEEKIALISQIRWNRDNYKPPAKKVTKVKAVAKPRKKKEPKPRTEAELKALIEELEQMIGEKKDG